MHSRRILGYRVEIEPGNLIRLFLHAIDHFYRGLSYSHVDRTDAHQKRFPGGPYKPIRIKRLP